MPPPNPESSNPATDCGIRAPSARETDLEQQVMQAQQKLDDLRKQLEAERARQQENYEAKKQRFNKVLDEQDFVVRLRRIIHKLKLVVKTKLPKRVREYHAIEEMFSEVWERRRTIQFDRFSDGDLDALEEMGSCLDKEEAAIAMLKEALPSEFYCRAMEILDKVLEE